MLKKYEEAGWAFEKVLACNPHNTEAQFALANISYMLQKYDNADSMYRAILAQNPHDAKSWYNLAENHFTCARFREAHMCFEKTKRYGGFGLNADVRIAACHEAMGNPIMAKNQLESMLHNPQLPAPAKQTIVAALDKLKKQYRLS